MNEISSNWTTKVFWIVLATVALSASYFFKQPKESDWRATTVVSPVESEVDTEYELPHSQPDKLLMELSPEWKLRAGDDIAWADPAYQDQDWQVTTAGQPWEHWLGEDYDGFGWFRKTVIIPSLEETSDLMFYPGAIDDVDVMYFNGKQIAATGSMPPNYITGFHDQRSYMLPLDMIRWGEENVLAIRVYDGGLQGGLFHKEMRIHIPKPRPKPEMDLRGSWEFALEETLMWEGENATWSSIQVPGIWENQGFADQDGFAWYRKTVEVVPELVGKSLVFLLGKVDDLDEIYIDGVKVGGTGTMPAMGADYAEMQGTEWQAFRGYYLPKGSIEDGKPHTISVRVYDGMGEGGIYEGPVGLISQAAYTRFWRKQRLREE